MFELIFVFGLGVWAGLAIQRKYGGISGAYEAAKAFFK